MDIIFRTQKLRKNLCSERKLVRTYGAKKAEQIKKRMVVLRAARNLAEVPTVPPFRRHKLKGKYKDYFAVDVKRLYRLIFRPANEPLPKLKDGGLDLKGVTQIEIITVEDYHR